jgi:hypothetical protein
MGKKSSLKSSSAVSINLSPWLHRFMVNQRLGRVHSSQPVLPVIDDLSTQMRVHLRALLMIGDSMDFIDWNFHSAALNGAVDTNKERNHVDALELQIGVAKLRISSSLNYSERE